MKVVAIAMVRDEADIIERTVRHMLTQVDEIIVADNGSKDGTREILDALPVAVLDDPVVGYYQSEKMTMLAGLAFNRGADWIVPFDADEVWNSTSGVALRDVFAEIPDDVSILPAKLFDHVATGLDPLIENPIDRIRWRRRHAAELPKVACRARPDLVIEQGNHGAHYTDDVGRRDDLIEVRHFPYRSAEQFVRKVRNGAEAYKATDFPDYIGAHWRQYGAILESSGESAVEGIFREWFWEPTPHSRKADLIFDPARFLDPAECDG